MNQPNNPPSEFAGGYIAPGVRAGSQAPMLPGYGQPGQQGYTRQRDLHSDHTRYKPLRRPWNHLLLNALLLFLVSVLVVILYPQLRIAFLTNPYINSFIIAVFCFGAIRSLQILISLFPEMRWLDSVRPTRAGGITPLGTPPKILRPLAEAIKVPSSHGRYAITSASKQLLLDSVSARIEDSRETLRYTVGVLVFLGLLGTFWGLLAVVAAVGSVLDTLSINIATVDPFEQIRQGLESPLAGMGTAFSSSLLGLAGSLVLGFLALMTSQSQNRFYLEFEDWLSNRTLVSGVSGSEHGDSTGFLAATVDQLSAVVQSLAASEHERQVVLSDLFQRIDHLLAALHSDRVESEAALNRQLSHFAHTLISGEVKNPPSHENNPE